MHKTTAVLATLALLALAAPANAAGSSASTSCGLTWASASATGPAPSHSASMTFETTRITTPTSTEVSGYGISSASASSGDGYSSSCYIAGGGSTEDSCAKALRTLRFSTSVNDDSLAQVTYLGAIKTEPATGAFYFSGVEQRNGVTRSFAQAAVDDDLSFSGAPAVSLFKVPPTAIGVPCDNVKVMFTHNVATGVKSASLSFTEDQVPAALL